MNLSNETKNRFLDMGENNIALATKLFVDRESFPVTAGTADIVLPDYIVDIRRVTLLGKKMYPQGFRSYQENFYVGRGNGYPFNYIFNNVGVRTIKLYPTPEFSVPQVTNVWDADIATGFIIEYSRTPGMANYGTGNSWGSTLWGTSNSPNQQNFQLPEYYRRRLLKQFLAFKVATIEGNSQSSRMSEYFRQKWAASSTDFYNFINKLHNGSRKLVIKSPAGIRPMPGRPVLPVGKFGYSVDEGF